MTRTIDECRAELRRFVSDTPGQSTRELADQLGVTVRQALTDLRAIGASPWRDGSCTRWWP